MPEVHPLESALSPVLKAASYTKRRLTWHRQAPGIVCVFEATKSQWGDQFQLNLGLYLRALGQEEAPPEYRCHVRNTMFALVPDRSRLLQLLDFEDASTGEGRLGEVVDLVVKFALPWLSVHSDEAALVRLVTGPWFPMITLEARTYLTEQASRSNQAREHTAGPD
jgi:Domain of unknown function (DUF4304)